MGLCEEGRHLRDYAINYEEDDVDCEDEDNYESDHCMRRRLRRDYDAAVNNEFEDVDCEDEIYESDHCMHRRLRWEPNAGEDDDEAD